MQLKIYHKIPIISNSIILLGRLQILTCRYHEISKTELKIDHTQLYYYMFVYNAVGKLSMACEQEKSIYRKSSIKPPGAYLISCLINGGLIREGALIVIGAYFK